MEFQLILIFSFTIAMSVADAQYDQDAVVLHKCLSHKNAKSNLEELRKIVNYSNWAVEEIPCFTRCIASEKGWFSLERSKWDHQKIVEDLGEDLYNYCLNELVEPFTNVCDFAHKGLRCLKRAEINIALTYTNLLSCAKDLNANYEQLRRYADAPNAETIPCLFKCLADKMNFYTQNYEWNFDNWVKAFGSMTDKNIETKNICKLRTDNVNDLSSEQLCAYMYEEYICVERESSDFYGYKTSGNRLLSTGTTQSVRKNEISKTEQVTEKIATELTASDYADNTIEEDAKLKITK